MRLPKQYSIDQAIGEMLWVPISIFDIQSVRSSKRGARICLSQRLSNDIGYYSCESAQAECHQLFVATLVRASMTLVLLARLSTEVLVHRMHCDVRHHYPRLEHFHRINHAMLPASMRDVLGHTVQIVHT